MLDKEISGRMMLLDHLFKRRIREETAEFDLSHGKLPVLEYIIRSPGSTQRELASFMIHSPASITQVTKKLEQQGMIERRQDPDDLRCNRLYPTELGIKAANVNRAVFNKADQDMLSGFTDEEIELLAVFLSRMAKNLNICYDYPLTPPWKENET